MYIDISHSSEKCPYCNCLLDNECEFCYRCGERISMPILDILRDYSDIFMFDMEE